MMNKILFKRWICYIFAFFAFFITIYNINFGVGFIGIILLADYVNKYGVGF